MLVKNSLLPTLARIHTTTPPFQPSLCCLCFLSFFALMFTLNSTEAKVYKDMFQYVCACTLKQLCLYKMHDLFKYVTFILAQASVDVCA